MILVVLYEFFFKLVSQFLETESNESFVSFLDEPCQAQLIS